MTQFRLTCEINGVLGWKVLWETDKWHAWELVYNLVLTNLHLLPEYHCVINYNNAFLNYTLSVELRYIENYERITHNCLCLTNHNGTYVMSRWQLTRYSLCVYNSQTTNIMLICWLIICQLLFITFYNTMANSLALCIDSISLDFLTQSYHWKVSFDYSFRRAWNWQ